MRDFRDSKLMAHALREALKGRLDLAHSECLEIVAKQFGDADWNVLAARVAAAAPKPDAHAVRFVRTYPVMRIFDVAKARDFYLDYLGFTVDFEHRFEPALPLYMQVSRAGLALHLSEHYGDGTPGHHVHVRMRNMRAFHAELLAKSGHYQNPGVDDDAPGGPRLKVWDPFGNVLHFAEAAEV